MVLELFLIGLALWTIVWAGQNMDGWMRQIRTIAQTRGLWNSMAAKAPVGSPISALVPMPSWAKLQGVTDLSRNGAVAGVVGLVASSGLGMASSNYDAAMKDAGWESDGGSSALAAVTYRRRDSELSAVVLYRETVPGTTSIVVEIQ